MKKLSPAQQKIIDMMRDGWKLRSSTGPDSRAWLCRVIDGRLKIVSVRSNSVWWLKEIDRIEFVGASRSVTRWRLK